MERSSVSKKIESLSVSERLVRNLSQKLKKSKKRDDLGRLLIEERAMETRGRQSSSSCLSVYIKGGGCSRVGSCEDVGINAEDCLPLKGSTEKRNSRKMKGLEQCVMKSSLEVSLPDDVLQMVLVRLPLRTLVMSRLVCKKWNRMIVSKHFVKLRAECGYKNPWVFVFGLTRKGVHLGEVFALDVVEDCWHLIRNDLLKDRVLYSVASIRDDIYIVGGCNDLEAQNGALVYSHLTNSWREFSPMKVARSEPVLGVFELSSDCKIFQSLESLQNRNRLRLKTRNYEASDVYEDPYRFSLRRQLMDACNESTSSVEARRKPSKHVGQRGSNQPNFALIVVGGCGSRDEPLDSGEIYNPMTDKWIEIARLPEDFGSANSGAVCNGHFYVYSSVSNKLASYDLERGFWDVIQTSQPPSYIQSYNVKLVSCRSRLFMCCVCWERDALVNNRGEQVARKLWELDSAGHSWTEVSRHPDAPMDKNATFVADSERIYGLDMFRVFGQALDFLTACHISDTRIKWSRVTRKHAGHEACSFSCTAKSMVVLHL